MNKQKSYIVKGDICALLISLVSITQPLSPSLATALDTMRVTMALILAPNVFREQRGTSQGCGHSCL